MENFLDIYRFILQKLPLFKLYKEAKCQYIYATFSFFHPHRSHKKWVYVLYILTFPADPYPEAAAHHVSDKTHSAHLIQQTRSFIAVHMAKREAHLICAQPKG